MSPRPSAFRPVRAQPAPSGTDWSCVPTAPFRALLARLLELLSPASCAACAGPRAGAPPFCLTCGTPPLAIPDTLGAVPLIVAGPYAPPLAPAIRRLKFEGHAELARPLARLLEPRLNALGIGPNASFVPVPLHRARLVERGFNQSALLASALAHGTGGHFAARALERSRRTDQQARLGRSERRANVHDAFIARPAAVPRRVVLVDDVVTTGATALACLKTLEEAGAEALAVVALARADPGGW